MDAQAYRTALATLGLSQLAAGRWLGVSNKTAQRYATTGPSGAAARAVGMAVALTQAERWEPRAEYGTHEFEGMFEVSDGGYVCQEDLTRALDLPAK